MKRKYIISVVPQGWNWEESYFRYTLSEYNKLMSRIYDNQGDALEDIKKFVILWTKDTTLKNRYFKGKFELSMDHFQITPAPDYRISGFDSKDEMLDYNSYVG